MAPVIKTLGIISFQVFLIFKTLQKTTLAGILAGISKNFVIMNVWYTNFILLHLADIWQNRKDVTNMARKVIERNISYDDIRKKYYVNLDYGVIDGKRKKKTDVFTKKTDARCRLTEFQHQKNTTGIAAPSDDTLADWLDYCLENIVKYLKADMGGIKIQKLTARRKQEIFRRQV